MRTVFDVLIDEIDSAIEREQIVIERGAPKDLAEYKYHVGALQALRQMRDYTNELKHRQEQYDE